MLDPSIKIYHVWSGTKLQLKKQTKNSRSEEKQFYPKSVVACSKNDEISEIYCLINNALLNFLSRVNPDKSSDVPASMKERVQETWEEGGESKVTQNRKLWILSNESRLEEFFKGGWPQVYRLKLRV